MTPIKVTIIARGISTTLAVAAAAYLAANNTGGWGWFLFAGVCLVPSYKETGAVE